ncbi:hypothetical protein INS49_005595 [Diaporthe citri]|uniref:uncharacterized protein n=1 Tax=Diaporthe citri TaxID=83186 RepID=UPI001C7E9A5E|nr:uncharacterized protein INS49_005595 [Diaporthe citri]KAG6353414.1 hypothetical protein INS49_005595 [Diaporthe citri]
MESRHSDTFGPVSLDGRMYVSTDQVQQNRISQNLEGSSRNEEYFDPAKHRDWGYRKLPRNRNQARSQSPPRTDGVMDAETGADGMIPMQEERSRAFSQCDAGTQTVPGGEEKTFWVNRRLDLALIPCMWFVFGTTFDGFHEGSSHTIIRGCVTNAAALVVQVVNYKALFSIRLGRYLGIAVLVQGKFYSIAGLVSSVVLLMDPGANDFGGDIVLQLLLAASRAVIGPCFVLLTAAWYANTNGGSIARLLLWASGYPVLFETVHYSTSFADSSSRVYYAMYCGFATVCILLSVYVFACVDMPGATMWLDIARRKGRLQGHERCQQLRSSPQLAKLVAEPTAWFAFGASFFCAASGPIDGEVLQMFYKLSLSAQAEADFLVLLPLAAFGYLVVKYPITRVPILALTAGLAFAGHMLLVKYFEAETVDDDSRFRLDAGALFLRNMMFYWQYLLWAILLLRSSRPDTADSQNLVANIVVAFAATALCRLLGYGALHGLTDVANDWAFHSTVWEGPTKIFMSIMFGLQILVLLGWFFCLDWQRQRRREGQSTSARPDITAELEC